MKTLLVLVTLVAASTSCKKKEVPSSTDTTQARPSDEHETAIRALKDRVLILEAKVDTLEKTK